ncbi:MAG: O-methyltransferase [Salinivirgaceae bacterium]|jgi:caffeoyl-CoA O-methyltransferase|nr:O-methyltransferase [Salinivirgaceae bacterium]
MFNNNFNKLDDYIRQHSSPESELLQELSRQTHLKVMRPRMLSEHIQGRVLSMLSRMIVPQNILEIGTFTGYSALCLAEGLAKQGRLFTYDVNDEIEEFTRSFIEKSSFADQIIYKIADARDALPKLDVMFDLAFIDGDKRQYPGYFKLVLPKLRKGGFIIADNVLWSEKVIDESAHNDPYTKGVLDFNRMVTQSDEVENVIFPFRDGLMVLQKK